MSDKEQQFVVLRCIGTGFDGTLIPGRYMGKNGRGNAVFAKAMLMADPKNIAHYLDAYGHDNYEAVPVILHEPE